MPKFTFYAEATVSCWTVVEADTAKEAHEMASNRDLAELALNPFCGPEDKEWHFGSDGQPMNIRLAD